MSKHNNIYNQVYSFKPAILVWMIVFLWMANACNNRETDNSNIFDPIDALILDQQQLIKQVIVAVNDAGKRTADLEVLKEVETLEALRKNFKIPFNKEMYSKPLNTENIRSYVSSLDSINNLTVNNYAAQKYEYIDRLKKNLDHYQFSLTNNISILSDLIHFELAFLNSRAAAVAVCSFGMTPHYLNSDNKNLKIGNNFRGVLSLEMEESEDVSLTFDHLYLKIDGDSIRSIEFEEIGAAAIIEFPVDKKGFYELNGQLTVKFFNNPDYRPYPITIRVNVGSVN